MNVKTGDDVCRNDGHQETIKSNNTMGMLHYSTHNGSQSLTYVSSVTRAWV
jgi:hypothetical protein